ncbi:MAG: hypothetical protein C4541_00840, partial [Candidatus Auribacter fodinae]
FKSASVVVGGLVFLLLLFLAFKFLIQPNYQLDKGIKKVLVASRSAESTQSPIYNELKQEVATYYKSSALDLKDIINVVLLLSKAGFSLEQILEGFDDVLDLAVVTYTDINVTVVAVSYFYFLFYEQLSYTVNPKEQLQYTANILAEAWQKDIELDEIVILMKHLSSIDRILIEVNYEDLIAALSVISNRDRQNLISVFVQIAKQPHMLRDLGIVFAARSSIEFIDVMNRFHNIYVRQGYEQTTLYEFSQVLGYADAQAIINVLRHYDRFKKEAAEIGKNFSSLELKLKLIKEQTFWNLLKIISRRAIVIF